MNPELQFVNLWGHAMLEINLSQEAGPWPRDSAVSGVICSRYDVMMTKNSINVSYNYKEYHRKNFLDTRIHMALHADPGSTLLGLVIVSMI